MDFGSADVMVVPSDTLANRMTCWDVGGSCSHPLLSSLAPRCAVMMGWRASAFLSHIATSLRATVIPEWS